MNILDDYDQESPSLHTYQLAGANAPFMVEVNGDFYDLPYGDNQFVTIKTKSPKLSIIQEAKFNIFQPYILKANDGKGSNLINSKMFNPMMDFFTSNKGITKDTLKQKLVGLTLSDKNWDTLTKVLNRISDESSKWTSGAMTKSFFGDVGNFLSGALHWLEGAIDKVTIICYRFSIRNIRACFIVYCTYSFAV